jgi:hypothetical protein
MMQNFVVGGATGSIDTERRENFLIGATETGLSII